MIFSISAPISFYPSRGLRTLALRVDEAVADGEVVAVEEADEVEGAEEAEEVGVVVAVVDLVVVVDLVDAAEGEAAGEEAEVDTSTLAIMNQANLFNIGIYILSISFPFYNISWSC